MKPLFPYYGSKWRSARLYGPPQRDLVVEPFAGAAGYSTFYEPEAVVLVDRDPVICAVWRYLIEAQGDEIARLPDLEVGEDVQELTHLPEAARWLIGFWLNRGSAVPKRRRTAYSARTDRGQLNWGPRARERIAETVGSLRHWTIIEGDYADVTVLPAQWLDAHFFVDPPYIGVGPGAPAGGAGRHYRCGPSGVDYPSLAAWCVNLALDGQPMTVCENVGADWMQFRELATIKSTRGVSKEVVWP